MLLTLPLVPVFMWLIGRYTERRTRERWQALSLLATHFADVVRGLPTLRAFNRGRVQTEQIDRSDVAGMWPFADLSPFEAFGWEARGGYGDAYMTAQAFAASARAAGVRVRQGTTVAELSVVGDRVTGVVLADGSEISSGTVVVATGVWTEPFLAPYGVAVPIRVVREQIVTIAPGVDSAVIGSLPVFSDLVSLQYVRPEVGGDILFGNSDLSEIEQADPDDYLNRATDAFVDLTVDKVGTRFPGFADAAISSSYAGCYDVTPDWNPVISMTALDGLVVAAGFSGHGFKIAPAVGRLVADLVVDGHSNDPRIPHSDFRHRALSFRPDGPVPGSPKLSGFLLIVQSIKKRGRKVDRVSEDGNRRRRRDCADAEKRIERRLNNFKFV